MSSPIILQTFSAELEGLDDNNGPGQRDTPAGDNVGWVVDAEIHSRQPDHLDVQATCQHTPPAPPSVPAYDDQTERQRAAAHGMGAGE